MNTGTPSATPGETTVAANVSPGVALNIGIVYGCYAETGELIYVGSTGDLKARLNTHRRVTEFYDRISLVRHGRWMSLPEAREIEGRLIALLRPPMNRAGNRDYDGLTAADQRSRLHEHMRRLPVVTDRPEIVNDAPLGDADHRRMAQAMSRVLGPVIRRSLPEQVAS